LWTPALDLTLKKKEKKKKKKRKEKNSTMQQCLLHIPTAEAANAAVQFPMPGEMQYT
jgi:hypothetical protein